MNKDIYKNFSALENPGNYRFEFVNCYSCNADDFKVFEIGQDDLTGKPGNFRYVKCSKCGLVYQNPRVHLSQIKDFYDDSYIAHKKKNIGKILSPLYNWAFSKHDNDKIKLISKFKRLSSNLEILDVGCAVGTFLLALKKKFNSGISGVDFKSFPDNGEMKDIELYCGLFYEQNFKKKKFDIITMWHFLEHCYDPLRSLLKAKEIIKDDGIIIIEVPRLDSVTYMLYKERWPGLQAPQHTVVFDKKSFVSFIEKSGLKVVSYLPYGAFPAYFYIYSGFVFKLLKGKGLDIQKHAKTYFLGQVLLLPVIIFEKILNLSMQTIVCRKA